MKKKIKKTKSGCVNYIKDHEKELGDAKFMLMFATMPVGKKMKRPLSAKMESS